jgi:hypothetical protein
VPKQSPDRGPFLTRGRRPRGPLHDATDSTRERIQAGAAPSELDQLGGCCNRGERSAPPGFRARRGALHCSRAGQGGEGLAVDASSIVADANKQRSVPGTEWKKSCAVETASRAMREYLATLDVELRAR